MLCKQVFIIESSVTEHASGANILDLYRSAACVNDSNFPASPLVVGGYHNSAFVIHQRTVGAILGKTLQSTDLIRANELNYVGSFA
jgi:hypothetical protein